MRLDHLHRVHAVDVVGPEDGDVVRTLIVDEIEALEDRVRAAREPPGSEPLLGRDRCDVVAEERREAPRGGDVAIE